MENKKGVGGKVSVAILISSFLLHLNWRKSIKVKTTVESKIGKFE